MIASCGEDKTCEFFTSVVIFFTSMGIYPLTRGLEGEKNEGVLFWGGGGGTNLSDTGLNLSGSWQQGHSATYNTPSRI